MAKNANGGGAQLTSNGFVEINDPRSRLKEDCIKLSEEHNLSHRLEISYEDGIPLAYTIADSERRFAPWCILSYNLLDIETQKDSDNANNDIMLILCFSTLSDAVYAQMLR
jgi:hypothetical protein